LWYLHFWWHNGHPAQFPSILKTYENVYHFLPILPQWWEVVRTTKASKHKAASVVVKQKQ
jgi:hypothetical protein